MTETTEHAAPPRPSERGRRKARRRPHLDRDAPDWLRGLAIGVVVLLAGVGVYEIGDSLTAPETAQVTVKVDGPPGGVMPGERFQVSGVISPGTERPVYLESREGAAWSRLATVQSDSDGRYTFPEARAREGDSFRVALPAIRNFGQSHAAVAKPVPGLRVVPQKVSDFSVLPGIAQNGEVPADAGAAALVGGAKFEPPRAGRPVQVQRRESGGDWTTVVRTRQASDGTVSFRLPQDSGSPNQVRLLAAPVSGASAHASAPQGSNRWDLKFDEQFTLGIDPARWSIRADQWAPESQRTCAKADPGMHSSEGGVAVLRVQPDLAQPPESCDWRNQETGKGGRESYYLNGHIGTQTAYSFRYGVAAGRVKFQEPRGMHGAFWLQDSGEADGAIGAEIDVVEFFGRGYSDGGIASFIYPSEGEEVGGTQPDASAALQSKSDAWWSRYHVFSVEWTPDRYVFRIDGHETLRTKRGVADRKAFVILSLLTSDWEMSKLPEAGTGEMSVDWVRVWQDTRLADKNL
jgi:beta-glucanase (GH16 family)